MTDTPSSPPPPARKMTVAAKAKLNELLRTGTPMSEAIRLVSKEPGAFEEARYEPPPPRPPWRGDSVEWAPVLEKLERLRALDRGLFAFGANRHKYRSHGALAESKMAALEEKAGVSLPPGLRAWYTTIADGDVGPGYGFYRAGKLKFYRPSVAFEGVDAIRARAPENPDQPRSRLGACAEPETLSGLVEFAELGCGITLAVVCTGEVGRVVSLGEGIVAETEDSLVSHYDQELSSHLRSFELVDTMRRAGAPRAEIEKALGSPAAVIELDGILRSLAG